MYFSNFALNTVACKIKFISLTKTLLHYSFPKHRHFWALPQRHQYFKLSVCAILARFQYQVYIQLLQDNQSRRSDEGKAQPLLPLEEQMQQEWLFQAQGSCLLSTLSWEEQCTAAPAAPQHCCCWRAEDLSTGSCRGHRTATEAVGAGSTHSL